MKTNRNNLAKRELLARLLSGDRTVKQALTGVPDQPWDPQHLTDEQIHKILYRHRDQIGLSEEQKQRCFTPEPYPYYDISKLTDEELRQHIKETQEQINHLKASMEDSESSSDLSSTENP